jgi:hypothetical protein
MAAEELANELIVLRAAALHDSVDSASHSIMRLISVVNACAALMRQHGDLFAAASNVADVTEITGPSHGSPRYYDSAHRAAVGEAGYLLLGLWDQLDPAGQKESVHEFLAEAGMATISDVANKQKPKRPSPVCADGTGLSPQLIVERWGEAKAELLQRLSAAWERDFRTIPAQIVRERTALSQARRGDRR